MLIKFPKNTLDIHWTDHVKRKMVFYGLSEQKIRSVIRNFRRKEEGVAPNTSAFMQRNDKPKRKEEIWVMSGKNKSKLIIISAWRYPGISKVRDGVPVPEDVLAELERFTSEEKQITDY